MRKNKHRKQKQLALFLCCLLCIANVVPAELTVWASEVVAENEPIVEEEPESDSALQDSQVKAAAEGNEEQEDAGQDPVDSGEEDPSDENTVSEKDGDPTEKEEGDEGSQQPENPENPENSEEEDGDTPQDPGEEIETEVPDQNPEEAEMDGETAEEIDGEEESPISTMADLNSDTVPEDAIAGGSYTEDGSDITWYIDKNGKLVVAGSGEFMQPYPIYSPWYQYCEYIKTAQIKVTGVTDASKMFLGCIYLTKVDLSGFDTSQVTDMSYMFALCNALKSLDLSGLDTSRVTDMRFMFLKCEKLESLDLSGLDTSQVTDMSDMFSFCRALKNLDLSSFDTSKVESMQNMFNICVSLSSLDVSSFDTSQVKDMLNMFYHCESLESLDLSKFDTSQVECMVDMFCSCSGLQSLDISSFNTSKVTSMNWMFRDCRSLTSLDLSSFDTSNVTDMEKMFNGSSSLEVLDLSGFDLGKVEGNMDSFLPNCKDGKLKTIYTPRNLKQTVQLRYVVDDVSTTETWYQADGTAIQELPQNLDYSIILTKSKPTTAITSSITASKKKTAYLCGKTVSEDDITVIYCDSKGEIIRLTTGFTTNAAEIDMTTPGKKTLVVTYTEPDTGAKLTAEIELTVTLLISADSITVTLPTEAVYVYNGYPHKPVPVVTLKSDSTVLKEGTDYKVSYTNNIDAGAQAAVTVEGIGNYSGKMTAFFVIEKVKVTIKAQDVTLAVNDDMPQTFAYDTSGFLGGDEKEVTGVSFTFADEYDNPVTEIDTGKEGVYQIIPKSALVGNNYVVDADGYLPGILIIAGERIAYTVSFDMMGHGTQTAAVRSIKAGSLVAEPAQPTAEGFLFKGWYKDRACTKVWDFAADTVQENITLYARWVSQTAQGGIQIQEIEDRTYTGSAIKPVVTVYAADGVTLLKSGKDYTVQYGNNILTDQVKAEGGTYSSLDGNDQSGFIKDLPYVVITGKGNHKGTVYRNFHIKPASISDAAGNVSDGFTLKYTDQLVYNSKKDQKPFTSLKYKKAMKAGTDYTVTLRAVEAYDSTNGNRAVESWNALGSQDNKWIPAIAKEYYGTFLLTISGQGNYTGVIQRRVYVAAKTSLLKNVTVTLGKNQKSISYSGDAITLTPGYYCKYFNKYYYFKVNESGEYDWRSPEPNANDLFTVKFGKNYLLYGKDYTVTYTNNKAVGTATMTITGIGSYIGSKSVTFKITGKAFKANTINVDGFNASMPYTGNAITQNKVTLTTKATGIVLDYGRHYTISYKNNIKKGTAAMTFTAKPESGYSGSFKKTFKIGAVSLDSASVKVEAGGSAENTQEALTSSKDEKGNTIYSLSGAVPYTREGAKPSKRICLRLADGAGNALLKEGTDYTVSYANNTVLASAGLSNKIPTMTFKGKGNYTGSVKVTFTIGEAAMEAGADNLIATAAAAAFDSRKADDYQYAPKITVKDGKKTLSVNKDYTVKYENCSQTEVKAYLDKLVALGTAGVTWADVQAIQPRAVITAVQGSGYSTAAGKEITVYLNIYETKLTGSNLYVVVTNDVAQTTYKGEQVTPEVTVYYGDANAVKAAKKDKVTDETKLTGSGLTKLTEKKDAAGDYTLTYGANLVAGKNKGSVTVSGNGKYGGSVTVKFDILSRNVYEAP